VTTEFHKYVIPPVENKDLCSPDSHNTNQPLELLHIFKAQILFFRDIRFSDSIHRPEDGNRSSFRNVVLFLSLFFIPGRWIESENPISLKVIHHRQNLIVTTKLYSSCQLSPSLQLLHAVPQWKKLHKIG
jgi:hypothetical protein